MKLGGMSDRPLVLRSKTPVALAGSLWLVCLGGAIATTITSVSSSAVFFGALIPVTGLLFRSTQLRLVLQGRKFEVHSWFRNRVFRLDMEWEFDVFPYAGFLNRYIAIDGILNGYRHMVILTLPSGRRISLPSTIGSEGRLTYFVTALRNRLAGSEILLPNPGRPFKGRGQGSLKAERDVISEFRKRRPDEALRLLEQWPEGHRDGVYWLQAATGFKQLGRLEEASKAALVAEEFGVRALSVRADICCERGEYVEAEKLYRKALASDPHNIDALRGLGLMKQELGQLDDAQRLLEAAFSHDETAGWALGALLMARNLPSRALLPLNAAIAAGEQRARLDRILLLRATLSPEEIIAEVVASGGPEAIADVTSRLRLAGDSDLALAVETASQRLDPQ